MGSILYFSVILVLLVLTFWPESGLLWRIRRSAHNTERVQLEDTLKHLYDQEYKDLKATLQSISGTLTISDERTTYLIARLETMGLVQTQGDGFDLTPQGRSYALKMIRTHRLWERYLADETGLAETDWHRKAEKLEHHMTDQEVDALAARVGHAPYDPHGDPIPTRSGKLPSKKGKPLTDLAQKENAKIIHVEDEPPAIYAQLVAENLHPGMNVVLLEKNPQRITFLAEDEEIVLAPVVAANITVEPLPKDSKPEGPLETLASLEIGEKGEVTGISMACRGQQRRRIMDLGVIPGTVITSEMRSAGGDPTAYEIRGATIALRKNQAELIHIKRILENWNHVN